MLTLDGTYEENPEPPRKEPKDAWRVGETLVRKLQEAQKVRNLPLRNRTAKTQGGERNVDWNAGGDGSNLPAPILKVNKCQKGAPFLRLQGPDSR